MKSQRFGIEIELTGITRNATAKVMAKYFNTDVIYEGGSYNTYTVKDNKRRKWKIISDSSITPRKKINGSIVSATGEYKVEIVSPILSYEDIEDLQEIIRQVRHKGAFVTSDCGIHIHIDASRHTPKTLKNLVNIIASKEDILYTTLKIASARLRYCKKVNEKLIEAINKKKPATIEELADIWYSEYPYDDRTRHYNQTRYHGLNLHATFTKGTIEFRCFNSTLHAGEVKAYIQLCMAVSYQALIQKSASCRRTLTDNPKYTFRCWMLRLGLIGDEFKTCRLHLLKNLEGDSAWRDTSQRHTA